MSDEPKLLVTVDWEKQSTEQILVRYQIGDHADAIAFDVDKPVGDDADEQRRVLVKAIDAAREVIGIDRPPTVYAGRKIADGVKLFRLIITEEPAKVRALYGAPGNPIAEDADGIDDAAAAIVAAAHALVEAKLPG
jgi:hypothetical protein